MLFTMTKAKLKVWLKIESIENHLETMVIYHQIRTFIDHFIFVIFQNFKIKFYIKKFDFLQL